MRDHTKLRAFQLADQVALAIYRQTRSFPREEVFGLTSQLRRAAVSIASNIVEGAARSSEAESLHFLDTAYGSAREVEYEVSLAFRLSLLPEQAHRELSALTVETSKVLKVFCDRCGRSEPLQPAAFSLQPASTRCPTTKTCSPTEPA